MLIRFCKICFRLHTLRKSRLTTSWKPMMPNLSMARTINFRHVRRSNSLLLLSHQQAWSGRYKERSSFNLVAALLVSPHPVVEETDFHFYSELVFLNLVVTTARASPKYLRPMTKMSKSSTYTSASKQRTGSGNNGRLDNLTRRPYQLL